MELCIRFLSKHISQLYRHLGFRAVSRRVTGPYNAHGQDELVDSAYSVGVSRNVGVVTNKDRHWVHGKLSPDIKRWRPSDVPDPCGRATAQSRLEKLSCKKTRSSKLRA